MGIGMVFVVFAITLLLGIPIAISIGISAIYAVLFVQLGIDAQYIFRSLVSTIDSYPLLAGPLFILSGNIMAQGGISKRLFDFFAFFIGKKTGGLPMAVVGTCLFYGAISGAAPATTAAVGAMTIPLLIELGYDKTFVTAIVAVSGALGVIIPPSIPFIIYGLVSGESVGSLFIAGVVPGLLVGALLMLYCWFYCKTRGEDKEKLSSNFEKLRANGFGGMLKKSFWALLSPVFILGGIYGGIVTPTEAANISVIYALIISVFVYKSVKIKDIPSMMRQTVRTVAPVMFIVANASVFGRVLTMMDAPNFVASIVGNVFTSKIAFLIAINVLLLIVGMLMETLTAILILTPILLPMATIFGVNPIHFGVIMTVNLALGYATPPVGMNLYIASGITGLPIMSIAKQAIPLIFAFIVALLIITFVPFLSVVLL
jgi:C4-dicarboxylate transporter DctM subunit